MHLFTLELEYYGGKKSFIFHSKFLVGVEKEDEEVSKYSFLNDFLFLLEALLTMSALVLKSHPPH